MNGETKVSRKLTLSESTYCSTCNKQRFDNLAQRAEYSHKDKKGTGQIIHEVRLSGVRASITIVHIRKFYRM